MLLQHRATWIRSARIYHFYPSLTLLPFQCSGRARIRGPHRVKTRTESLQVHSRHYFRISARLLTPVFPVPTTVLYRPSAFYLTDDNTIGLRGLAL